MATNVTQMPATTVEQRASLRIVDAMLREVERLPADATHRERQVFIEKMQHLSNGPKFPYDSFV